MLSQRQEISPPKEVDKSSLEDFASVIQQAFADVFDAAHTHTIRTTAPATNEGNVGDIVPVVLSGVGYLYVKLPTIGWKRVALS